MLKQMIQRDFHIPTQKLAELCQRWGVRRLWVFGSVLRGDFRSDSDIDVLIETDPDHTPGLFALGGLQMDLSDLLGRHVDLAMLGGVPLNERERLLSTVRLQYAA